MKWGITFPIFQKASDKSLAAKISQTPSAKLSLTIIGQSPTDQLVPVGNFQTSYENSPFTLNWSHYAPLDWVREQEASV